MARPNPRLLVYSKPRVREAGSVADGLYLLKISPNWTRPKFELYAGHNDKADHKLIMYLGDEVAFVRFASVYREFRDVGELIEEAEEVRDLPSTGPGQRDLFEAEEQQ